MESLEKSDWSYYLYYDETSSSGLRWKFTRYKIKADTVAGGISKGPRQGYYRVKLNGKMTFAHRIVWEIFNKPLLKGEEIDHIDGNKLNNKINNLRVVSRTINCHNRGKQGDNKTGIVGVSLTNNGQNNFYYTAHWREGKKTKSKHFSVDSLGSEEAFNLACEFRENKIKELNNFGEGYTNRHGE